MAPKFYQICLALSAALVLHSGESLQRSAIAYMTEDDSFDAVSVDREVATRKIQCTTPTSAPKKSNSSIHRDHLLSVGGNYTYTWITPKGDHTVKGSLGGAQFLYEFRPPNSIYAGLSGDWRIGKPEHHGASRKIQDINVQERVGYTFSFQHDKIRLSLFSGIGVRCMPETVQLGTTYLRLTYTNFYVPVGAMFEKRYYSHFAGGLQFQWRPQVLPLVHIKPLSGAEWNLTYKLNNFYFAMPLKFIACDSKIACSLSPFFELWHDGKTTATTLSGSQGTTSLSLNLPKNKYLFAGVNLNFEFIF